MSPSYHMASPRSRNIARAMAEEREGSPAATIAAAVRGIHVALRIRPLHSHELQASSLDTSSTPSSPTKSTPSSFLPLNSSPVSRSPIFHTIPEIHAVMYCPNQCQTTQIYQVDRLFDEMDTIEAIYHHIGHRMIQNCIHGVSSAIFVYGMTSVGKTFTMQGGQGSVGLVQLATYDLLRSLSMKYTASEYRVYASYVEIYNENIKDLVCENLEDSQVILREDKSKGIVSSASEHHITHYKDAVILFKKEGNTRRSVEATAMNYDSSRSHTIFKFRIEYFSGVLTTTPASPKSSPCSLSSPAKPSTPVKVRRPSTPKIPVKPQSNPCSVLYLVDLAGSESVRLTGSCGQRVKESGRINQSLLSLGRVIHSLFNQNQSTSHISYRDSKLTRLLQPVLTVERPSSIWMICCVTFASWCAEETRNTLEFADDIRLLRTLGISSKSTTSVAMKRLKEQKADLFRRAAAVEDLLISSEELSSEVSCEIIPAVGSVDSMSCSPKSQRVKLAPLSTSVNICGDVPTQPNSPLLRMLTQSIDDPAPVTPRPRRPSKSSSSPTLAPIHSYIDLNEFERVWHDIDDPIAALFRREEHKKRHELLAGDSTIKGATINLEKLRESAALEVKIWADTLESSRLKSAIDTAELNQKRAKVESLRLKAMNEKVIRLQQQAEAMASMKREIYERLCLEIEEVQMKLYLEKLQIARELCEMRKVELECVFYETEKNSEEQKEWFERNLTKMEEIRTRNLIELEKQIKESQLMSYEELLTIAWSEQERERIEVSAMGQEEQFMLSIVAALKEQALQEAEWLWMSKEEEQIKLFVSMQRQQRLESLKMAEEEWAMNRFIEHEREQTEGAIMLREEQRMSRFVAEIVQQKLENMENVLMTAEEQLVTLFLEDLRMREREGAERLKMCKEDQLISMLVELKRECSERSTMILEDKQGLSSADQQHDQLGVSQEDHLSSIVVGAGTDYSTCSDTHIFDAASEVLQSQNEDATATEVTTKNESPSVSSCNLALQPNSSSPPQLDIQTDDGSTSFPPSTLPVTVTSFMYHTKQELLRVQHELSQHTSSPVASRKNSSMLPSPQSRYLRWERSSDCVSTSQHEEEIAIYETE